MATEGGGGGDVGRESTWFKPIDVETQWTDGRK
jgi:hypothetical protein